MGLLSGLFSLVKLFLLAGVLLAIGIPAYYKSTNVRYLRTRLIHSIVTLKYSINANTDRPALSPEYVAFETLLKNRPLFKYDSMNSISEVVEAMRSTFPFGDIIPRPTVCQSHENSFVTNGRSIQYYSVHHNSSPVKIQTDRVVLYFHGGGYIVGDFPNYCGFECHLSELLNSTLIHMEYERTPENSVPSIVKDAVSMYRHLLDQGISSSRIVIMGDSAGGGLTILTIQSIISQNLPKPRATVTFSPWTDLTLTGESLKRNRKVDVMLHTDQVFWMVKNIIEVDPKNLHLHSSLFGSFKDFPPLYVSVGTAEILEDDSTRIVEKAKEEGVDVTFAPGEHMMHVYPLLFDYFPEARQSLHKVQQWIEQKFI